MTSTHNTHTPSDSRLSQSCLDVSVKESIGALQGTMIQDFNLGGSLLCQNTTFAICQTSPSPYQDDFIAKVFKSFFAKEIPSVITDYMFSGSYGPEDIFHFWSLRPGGYTDGLTPCNYSTVSTSISFTTCTFTGMVDSEDRQWPHTSGGGAIRHMCLSPLTVTGCTFSQCNTTVGSGGAILSNVAASDIPNLVTINSSSFTSCSALSSGGAVAFVENGVCLISKSHFTNCSCDGSGGGASTFACTVTDSVFESNSAKQNSGGIHVDGNDATIRFSRFSNNSAASGHKDTNLMDVFSDSWTFFGCRWSADGSWESQSTLFVADWNADGDCSNESPCASLSKAIGTINADETHDLRMSSGSFGSAEIDRDMTLTITHHFTEAVQDGDEQPASFSLLITARSSVEVKSMLLSPIAAQPLVRCSGTASGVFLSNLHILNLQTVTASLFVFAAGATTLHNIRAKHISGCQHPLIDISGAGTVIISHSIFDDIKSSSCVISVNEVDTTIDTCHFKNIERTSGNGAAALDVKTQLPFTLGASFVRCSSLQGKAGALFLDTTDPTVLTSYGTFFIDNRGKDDTSAHDIFVNSPMIDAPLFSNFMSTLSRTPSLLDNEGRSHDLNGPSFLTVFDDDINEMSKKVWDSHVLSQSDLESINFSDVLQHQDDLIILFHTHPKQSTAIQSVDVPSNTRFEIGADIPSYFTTITQSGANPTVWFTCKSEGDLTINFLTLFISSSRTTAPFVLQDSSRVTLSTCIFHSDGGQSKAPFFSSNGELTLQSILLSDLTFDDCSCIVATGGMFTVYCSQGQVAACFSNITSTGNGSVLNACDTAIQIAPSPFLNCHAANGGALYLHNCEIQSIAAPFFDCSATQRGGAVYVSDNRDEDGQLQIDPICFVRCSADLGGAFFLLNTGSRSVAIGGYPTAFMIIQRVFAFPLFFDCTARVRGSGGYLDGSIKDDQISLTMFSSSNSALSEGSDLFITSSLYNSLQDPASVFSNMKDNCWSLSGRSEKPGLNKHVAVEDHPEASFNFEIPVFAISLYEGQRSYSCANAAYTDCTVISDYLEFIHTRTDDDAFFQVPVYLQKTCHFVEMGRITKQSVLLLKSEDPYQLPFTEVDMHESEFSTSTDTVFFSVEEQGALEIRDLILVWNNKRSLCQSAHPTALTKLTECTLKLNITLEISLIICQAGSLSIDHSTFTSEGTPIPITSPIITTGLSSLSSNSETGGGKITLSELTLENLVVGGTIGTIELDNVESVSLSKLTFTNVVKDGVSDNAVRIIITGSELHKHIVPTSNNGFTRNDDEDLYQTLDLSEHLGSVYRAATLLIYLSIFRNEVIIVGTEGRDINGCGDDKYVCHSLDIADTHLLSAVPSTISILDSAELNTALDLTMDLTTITSKGAQSTVVVSSEGALINHKTGSVSHELVLEKLKFSFASGRSSSLIQSTSGSLFVSSCDFSSTSSNAVFLHSASALITRCSFASLSNPTSGGAVHAELSSSDTLTITSCSFDSCSSQGNGGSVSVVVAGGELEISDCNFTSSSSEQNGGALFVDLSSLETGSYRLTSLSFTSSCTCSGDGKWVFVTGQDFVSLVTKASWTGTFESLRLRSDADKLWGLDLAEAASSPRRSISLLHFLLGNASRTAESIVFVGQNGKDEMGCGETKTSLCRTVEWSLTEAAGSVVDIAVVSNALLTSSIVLSHSDVQISSDSGILCPFAVSLDHPSSAPTSMIRMDGESALALSFLSRPLSPNQY
ncbi:hypothetical protein BLNAU_22504 [Blattamonas nauphoetae]|uniref:Uncharacterized protein n=1 Tax=Blattamonas nauphoetae TaxID=2049346 RepID=A0ABQ9WSW1_9EUKA|nr:hypothetical protein BLNAU_22504 [Blattamonas nauphoetae]